MCLNFIYKYYAFKDSQNNFLKYEFKNIVKNLNYLEEK